MNFGRLVRFGLVGVVNTASYVCLYLLLQLVLPYLLAHVVAFLVSMVGSYFLNCRFTFRTRPTLRKFLLFPLSNITNFVVTSTGLYVLVEILHFDKTWSPLLAASVAVPITFLVARTVLVGKHSETEPSTALK